MDFALKNINKIDFSYKMVPAKLKQDDPEPPIKYKADHKLFQRLEVLLVEGDQSFMHSSISHSCIHWSVIHAFIDQSFMHSSISYSYIHRSVIHAFIDPSFMH